MIDIMEEYTQKLLKYTDAPEVFIRGAAYYLVSATLGEFFRNRLVPFGCQRPNIWIVLSSIPGRTRRSTVQRVTYNTFKEVVGEGAEGMIIEDGTPEGIMDTIQEFPSDSYTIQSTEFGAILRKMKRRDHAIGISSLLSKLYYGEGGKQVLSQRGGKSGIRILPPGLFVTMFAGLQEPQHYFTPEMLYQGLLRRILVIYVKKSVRWMPPIDDIREFFSCEEIVSALRERRGDLEEYCKEHGEVHVVLYAEAEKMINDYAEQYDRDLDERGDDLSLYRQSLWEHLLKLATFNAMMGCEDTTAKNERILSVTLENVKKAKNFLTTISEGMEHVIDSLGSQEETVRTSLGIMRKILRRISDYEDGVSLNDLAKRFPGIKRKKFNEYLDTLCMQNQIRREIVPSGSSGGRPKKMIRLGGRK